MQIEMRPFSEEEFIQFKSELISSYADALMKSGLFDEYQEAFNKSKSTVDTDWIDGLGTKRQHLFQIEQEGQSIGRIWYAEMKNHCAWFNEIYIEPDFRRQGYATLAIAYMEMHLKSLGIKRVTLNVFAYNLGAKILYEHLGYSLAKLIYKKNSAEIASYQLAKDL